MSLLIFAYRKQNIIARKNELNYKLMKRKQELMDLQHYASEVAEGAMTMNKLMGMPCTMFNRATMFMMYGHQAAMAGANEKFNFLLQTPGAIQNVGNAQLQVQYNQTIFKNLYNQEKQKFQKMEEKILNQQDRKIQLECERIQTQLAMLDAELNSVKQAEDKAAQDSAPKYVA